MPGIPARGLVGKDCTAFGGLLMVLSCPLSCWEQGEGSEEDRRWKIKSWTFSWNITQESLSVAVHCGDSAHFVVGEKVNDKEPEKSSPPPPLFFFKNLSPYTIPVTISEQVPTIHTIWAGFLVRHSMVT